jgi:hypothetical protein
MIADVRVMGIVRGRDIDRAARVSVEDDGVLLAWHDATPWRLAFDGIDGIASSASSLTLYLPDHDVLEVVGDDPLRLLGQRLMDTACRMPELTRGLRGLGAVRADRARQGAHDRWFAPLLAARRAVQDISDPARQVALMDGATLADDMLRAISEIAASVAPTDIAEQRAMDAAIEDEAAALFLALRTMAIAGDAVHHGATDTRFADWRRWVETVRAVFGEADDAWAGVSELL